ncbi:hypothetical protein HGM15179_020728, partial [Zosterops borbonicus]
HATQALAALTIDQLAGEGVHTDPNGQAALPREALEGIMEAARYAFLKVPDAKTPQQSFINIKQAPQEPYMQFVDRLKQTLERQIDNDQAREVVLLKLSAENANEDFKLLLKTLPPEPEPTLPQMFEPCNRLGTLQHATAVTYHAVGQGIADAFAALKILPGKQSVCFGCGEPRHIKNDCRKTKTLANLDKNHFLANTRKKFLRDNDANLINPLAISSALRCNKLNEISIRLTHEIDIRKSFSRNETMSPDEIREGHREEIRTIKPILDTWTA